MKKFWKIFGITLASLILLVVVAAAVALYMVFTPKRLTPIVNQIADIYITAPHNIGDVELTVFSTFPEVGLQVNGLYVVNPMDGAQTDTILSARKLVAALDVKKYLDEKTLDVREVSLYDATVDIYINKDGETNLNVFSLPEDTTEQDSAFSLPFNYLGVDRLALQARRVTYRSDKDSMYACLNNVELNASAKGMNDINLSVLSPDASFTMKDEQYARNLPLGIVSEHTGVDLDNMHFTLPDAKLSVDAFDINLNGSLSLADDMDVDAAFVTSKWDIPALLALLPASLSSSLNGIEIEQGTLALRGTAKGVYNDTLFPVVNATLALSDAEGSYMEVFPYKLSDINLDADALLNLNERKQTAAKINSLKLKTGKTSLTAKGEIAELLDDPLCDLNAQASVNLPEFKRYLESPDKHTDLAGNADVSLRAKIRLSALEKKQLAKGSVSGSAAIRNLALDYDSMLVRSGKTNITFAIPNKQPKRNTAGWIKAALTADELDVDMPAMSVQIPSPDVKIEASDVLNNSNMLYAAIDFLSTQLTLKADSMGGNITKPDLKAYVEYNMKDSTAIPTVDATLAFNKLDGFYDDMKAVLAKSGLTAKLTGTRRDNTQPRAKITLSTEELSAKAGDQTDVRTQQLDITAEALRNPKKDNFLLQWNPKLQVALKDGDVALSSFSEKISIPDISFSYSNKLFDIASSHIILGNSDFSLKGQIHDIGPWLEDKGVLRGELDFKSRHTDVNELMALTSAESGSEEAEPETSESNDGETHAYLVPKNVDLTLNTDITEALVFDQVARELGGHLYVKEGVLVLEEMGFICNAARLQLTAIYKTPRRNHIYAGLDYHMMDIDMQELVNMIPQIDTMMPMLRSFRGTGEFHLAAETYLNDKYQLKTSTTRGACSITGNDLVLLDSETFGKISKILLFNRKTENKIDSISAQATLFKKEIDIYPFCISMDKYMAAVGGRHNLDMSFDYHISLLKPFYIGVDVTGTFDDLKIKAAKCKYAQDFRPIIRRDIETQNISLKKMIDETLKRNVKP